MPNTSRRKRADTYRVPERFSIAEVLAMTTVFGLLFGGLRCFGASPIWYLFLGTQGVVVCLVQMTFGAVPRGASTVVGCIFLPVWGWVLLALGSPGLLANVHSSLWALPFVVLYGGLLGYCTGTMVAGVFLVMDTLAGLARRSARWRARLP